MMGDKAQSTLITTGAEGGPLQITLQDTLPHLQGYVHKGRKTTRRPGRR
jgi:hypothetical protein